MKLNTPGQLDGEFLLFVDGNLVIDLADLNYREDASIQIMGMMFSTFFGGGDPSWYPSTNQYIDFKDFALDEYSNAKVPSAPDHCVSNTCHTDATCTNTYDGYTCACNAGFTGDGTNCEQGKITIKF